MSIVSGLIGADSPPNSRLFARLTASFEHREDLQGRKTVVLTLYGRIATSEAGTGGSGETLMSCGHVGQIWMPSSPPLPRHSVRTTRAWRSWGEGVRSSATAALTVAPSPNQAQLRCRLDRYNKRGTMNTVCYCCRNPLDLCWCRGIWSCDRGGHRVLARAQSANPAWHRHRERRHCLPSPEVLCSSENPLPFACSPLLTTPDSLHPPVHPL